MSFLESRIFELFAIKSRIFEQGISESRINHSPPLFKLLTFFLFADWSPEQVKKWIFGLFGDAVAQKFIEEEIDGRTLLESKRLEEDSTLEKLGITTIGKKERFKRELGAIRPIVNGRYHFLSSLLRFINDSALRI